MSISDRVDKGRLWEWRPEEHGKVLKSGNAEKKSRRLLLLRCPHTHSTPHDNAQSSAAGGADRAPSADVQYFLSEEVHSVLYCRCFYKSLAWLSPISWCAIFLYEGVSSVYCWRCFYKYLAWPSPTGWCAILILKKCLLNSTVLWVHINLQSTVVGVLTNLWPDRSPSTDAISPVQPTATLCWV